MKTWIITLCVSLFVLNSDLVVRGKCLRTNKLIIEIDKRTSVLIQFCSFSSCFLYDVAYSKGARLRLRSNTSSFSPNKKLVCYFTNWAQYRPKEGKYLPEDVDAHLCTHIIFAFGWMKKNKLSSFDATDETKNGKKGLYERLVDLKKKNSKLKVLLAVGKLLLIPSHLHLIK